MIFTLDIGNTNIKTALFNGPDMVKYWRVSTNKMNTSDEYGILLTSLFRNEGMDPAQVEGIIISSVVPTTLPSSICARITFTRRPCLWCRG